MNLRRFVLVLLVVAVNSILRPTAWGQDAAPAATARALCDALLNAMKMGPSLVFAEREKLLAPEIQRDLDLSLMTRIAVGPSWRNLSPADAKELVDAFSDYSIATYAERFKGYSGERFEVDPTPTPTPRGDSIVHTKLFTGGPNPVQLDYLMRKTGEQWRIIDVYLNGTISEMAARRSEYSATISQGGAPALIALLRKKTAELGG
jgi:phospholipid transport system substrate-binding protein